MSFNYRKYELKRDSVLIDPRNHLEKFKEKIKNPQTAATFFIFSAAMAYLFYYMADIILFYNILYFYWFVSHSRGEHMPFRLPKSAKKIDPGYKDPAKNKPRMADGILYLGNEERSSEEIWFTNTDARTHILYLGTTGSGKTEGLKSFASNALGWGSGFIYVDGKADTDLWGALSALARRFGRDDDLLVLNYMTGNSDNRIASNTVNPFAQGSASYLTNLLVSLMPEVQGDNAMWKDRAVALMSALMPVLTWQRKNQDKPLNITVIRDALNFKRVIEYSRRPEIPDHYRKGVRGYLDTLPGYTDSGFNDDGTEKPNANGPPMDYSTIYQQHGYLAMQFTRQLQSLADDYGYIFETQAADIDMMDVVLNRRIVVVLIPALEKSADETANLGKIVGSMLKGMMGATLGSTVEGDTDLALENKPTRSSTPFMAIFDEVGYYTTQGMAVMAAQARSLGFSLVFAGQDLPALEKRVKEEARSITANCNIKIFGKLEDPTQTKEFFEKTVGETNVIEASTRKEVKAMFGQKKIDKSDSFNVTTRTRASYSQLKDFKEGQAVVSFGSRVVQAKMFYSDPGKIRSLRVNKFVPMAHPDPDNKLSSKDIDAILERINDKQWTAQNARRQHDTVEIVQTLFTSFNEKRNQQSSALEATCYALAQTAVKHGFLKQAEEKAQAAAAQPVAQPVPPKPMPVVASAAAAQITPPDKKPELPLREERAALPSPDTKGKEETISWGALVGNETDAAKSTVQATSEKPDEAMPDTSETVSWKDLMGSGEKAPIPSPPAKPTLPSGFGMPTGGFGVPGYGTGFGGMGSTGFGGVPTVKPVPRPIEPPPQPPVEVKKSDGDETVSWKDLIDNQ